MQNEKTFELNSVALSNVGSILHDMGKLHELTVCELSFAAERIAKKAIEMINEGMTLNEVVSLLAEEIAIPIGAQGADAPDVTRENIKSFVLQMSNINKAVFATLLNKMLSDSGVSVDEADYLPKEESEETFAYVKSSLADEAFDVFSQEFSDPRIIYADSFKDACFKVSEGKVGYCILPFEEKGGARINSIANLVASLDLKIVAITPVFGFEGNADMKYALISRGFIIPEKDELTDRYLEISINRDSTISIGELISAAEYLGVSLFCADTAINNTEDGDLIYTLVFKDGVKSFSDFLTYLSIFAGAYVPVGFYKNIE